MGKFSFVLSNTDFISKELSDFCEVLILGKKLLVVTSALGGGSGCDKHGEFIIEIHLSALTHALPHFFLRSHGLLVYVDEYGIGKILFQ